jgi:hypothetical protein
VLLFAGAWQACAQTAPGGNGQTAVERKLHAVADISFRGTSTLHDFEGSVESQPFVLLLSTNSWSAQAEVLGSQMTTANEKRDRNMWNMLSTSMHPRLAGLVTNAPLPIGSETNVTLALRIRDRQFELPVQITEWSETAETIRFHASWEVSLKQYNLKPPSVLGVIRVGDTVRLDAEVTANKAGTKPLSTSQP